VCCDWLGWTRRGWLPAKSELTYAQSENGGEPELSSSSWVEVRAGAGVVGLDIEGADRSVREVCVQVVVFVVGQE
jgi:hypothetical protein